jgi:hypothetical protein
MADTKKSNMYEGVETINFLNGKCLHDCSYCSSKFLPFSKHYYEGELRLNENAFKKNLGKGKTWFVCAQNDLFAENVPAEWIERILNHIRKYPNNTYLLQSKNPYGYKDPLWYLDFEDNWILGITLESNIWYPEIMKNSPTPIQRGNDFLFSGYKKFVTIEPILEFDLDELSKLLRWIKPDYINIGADSKNNHLPEPSKEKVLQLIEACKEFTEVRLKSNLTRIIGQMPEVK